uniref:Uncharacterized protein n=1 Tax=Chloropicon laureae TaxID=464258 RepID=A0A7S3E209_9CHLO|mmetsp:Transcript_2513/g.6340  ORF Transcript_2513/g.6340 Transcript_2513/m.6340 type:complete len:153 (+) Transcript_2513:240-698(+)
MATTARTSTRGGGFVALAVALLALVLSAHLPAASAGGRRHLQDDYVRAVDAAGNPAPNAVPFTSWPAARRATFYELFAEDLDNFVDNLPSIFEQQLQDSLFDDEDGLLFGDDGIWDSDFLGFDFADIVGNLASTFFGIGSQLTDALNFFGIN